MQVHFWCVCRRRLNQLKFFIFKYHFTPWTFNRANNNCCLRQHPIAIFAFNVNHGYITRGAINNASMTPFESFVVYASNAMANAV